MSKGIHWYEVESLMIDGYGNIRGIGLPEGAQIVNVAMRQGRPTLWAIVDITSVLEDRKIFFVATGQDLPEGKMISLGLAASNVEFFHVLEMIE